MPRISAEEKENATLIPLERLLTGEDDVESAFNDFRGSFHTGDEPGMVRAWELIIDERGNVGTTKMQQRLGAWPIDAYQFDELCALIVDQYMDVGQTRMAVRLVGTKPEQTGYVFNKIVMLKRALKRESSREAGESTSSMMKAMQEMNERNMEMFRRMQPTQEKPDTMAEMQKMMIFAQSMNAPMMTMLQSLLPALAGRPAPAGGGDPFASLGGLIDVAERLSEMKGGGGGSGDDDSWAGILRAIAPLAKPALEALPAIAAMRPAPRVIPAPAPAAPKVLAPGSTPTAPTTPHAGTADWRPPPSPANATNLTDLPSEESAMLAQMKPQIDSLVAMAQQGSDATGAADLIFDQVFMDPRLPEDAYEKLAGFIDSEKFVPYVVIMNPAAKPHGAWFETFKIQIVKRLLEETAAADAAEVGDSSQAPPLTP